MKTKIFNYGNKEEDNTFKGGILTTSLILAFNPT